MSQIPNKFRALIGRHNYLGRVFGVFENIEWEIKHKPESYNRAGYKAMQIYYTGYSRRSALRMRYYNKRTRHAAERAKGALVLDVGCSFGTQCFLFSASGAAHVDGIDIDPIYIKTAQERAGLWGVDNVAFSARSIFDCQESLYDLIFVMETLHHIVPLNDFFPRVMKLLKPGGQLIISEPNGENPFVSGRISRRGWNSGKKIMTGNYFQTDEMVMSASCVISNLESAGLHVEAVEHYRIFPSTGINTVDGLLCLTEPFFENLFPLRVVGVGYTVIATRPQTDD